MLLIDSVCKFCASRRATTRQSTGGHTAFSCTRWLLVFRRFTPTNRSRLTRRLSPARCDVLLRVHTTTYHFAVVLLVTSASTWVA